MCGVVCAFAIEASAQTQVGGGFTLDGEVRSGIQFFINEPSDKASAKFDEYRDVHNGLFLESLYLRLKSPGGIYSGTLEGSKWGRTDQEYGLGLERLGLWYARFEWDQTPHVYSRDTARLLAQDIGRNVFVLSTPRPSPLTLYNGGQTLDQVGVLWQTGRLSFMLTPTPEWELKAEYTRIHKEGTRAIGISYQTPMNNFADFLEPVNQLIHDLRLGGTYAAEKWQVRFGYAFSMFQNFRNSVTGDNPCFGLTSAMPTGCTAADGAPGTPAAPGAEASGKVSLAPNNMAHTFTLSGGASLPMRTRVNANVSYSLRLQNDEFLPSTNTPGLAGNPGLFLPDKSLQGVTGVFLGNLNVVSRPMPPLTLSFKYRIFDLHDMSQAPIFPCGVESDSRIYCDAGGALPGGPPRQAKRIDFTKQDAEVDSRWRFNSLASATLGVGWQGWDRNSTRNVYHSDEPFGKAVIEVNPADWLYNRLEYRLSFLRNSNYNPRPTHIATDQSPLERKVDLAERNTQQINLLTQVSPIDTVSVGVIGSWRSNDYIDSPLGVQQSVDWAAGMNISWRPTERVTLSVGYVHDWAFTKQQQNAIFPGQFPAFPTYAWLSDNADTTDTYNLRLDAIVIPKKLDFNLGFSYASAIGTIKTRNPSPPPSGGPVGQNNQAIAQRFPAFEDELLRLDAGLTYHFDKVWTATLGYALETWHKKDFRTDTLNPFIPNVTSIFLGENYNNYTVNIVSLVVGYKF